MISVLYFDENTPKDELYELCQKVKSIIGEDGKVIALPKKFDLLIDCSTDQLLQVRAMIDTALQLKIEDEELEYTSFLSVDDSILPC